MAGNRAKRVISDFYCINCGKKGIPVWRKRGHLREPGHRKALYCTTCGRVVNHIEIRTMEEAEKFRKEYAEGKYAEEARESIQYALAREEVQDA